ncbi:MAG: hypothetical protein ACYSW8_17335 [Planctomycetota bacterium]
MFRTALIGWIWLVTAVDIWCCQWLTLDAELNPIGVALIAEFGVWGMVAAKVVGTWLATEWLRYLHIGYSVFAAAVMLLLLLVLGGVIPV